MAAWGQGDPRWIVQHRDDGKNVNGWHWEEKNKLDWSRQRIGELFIGLQTDLTNEAGCISLTKLKELTGEALMTTRKGNKKCAVFDLNITLQWEADIANAKDKVKGELKIEEFASTGDADDYVLTVTAEGVGDNQDLCRRTLEGLRNKVTDVLQQFTAELIDQ